MKFLVIFICLALNYYWLKDYDRFDDRWFFRFRATMEATAQRLGRNATLWWPGFTLTYALPMLFLFLLLQLVAGSIFDLPTMLIHILVVLVAFDRTQPGKLARDFLEIWEAGDQQAGIAYLRQEFRGAGKQEFANEEEVAYFFRKNLVYRFFEKMFVLFFWYLAAGPLGVLASYITYQMRDGHDEQTNPAVIETVDILIHLLEWIPLRLVALSFSLAGNFVHCFNQLKKSFWEFGRKVDNAGLLYSFAGFALFGGIAQEEAEEDDENSRGRNYQVYEIESLQGLLERCQLLWLSLLALFTIFGPVL